MRDLSEAMRGSVYMYETKHKHCLNDVELRILENLIEAEYKSDQDQRLKELLAARLIWQLESEDAK